VHVNIRAFARTPEDAPAAMSELVARFTEGA
jgi:hypothetical protein